jgi:hypothetical protein
MGLNDIETEGTFLWGYTGTVFDSILLGKTILRNDEDPGRDCVYYDGIYDDWYATYCYDDSAFKYVCEISLSE